MGGRIWLAPTALAAGIAAAALVAGVPALAADHAVTAQPDDTWSQSQLSVAVGDSVTWSNGGGFHNVCVSKPGSAESACDEFRNGDPAASWATYTNSHVFNSAGTYSFICETHASFGMKGTITVGSGGGGTTTTSTGTGTGTGTTPPPYSQPTDTTTTPAQTETQATPADTTAPAFTTRPKRRASRRSLVLDVSSSEDATLSVTVSRRAPRTRAFKRVGSAAIAVHGGRNVVKVPRTAAGRARAGAYRVRLQLVDAAGNRSGARTVSFKVA